MNKFGSISLRAIPNLTEDELIKYSEIYRNLIEAYGPVVSWHSRLFENYKRKTGYANYEVTGKLKPELSLTPLEVSMIVDDGYSHFGGCCSVNQDGTFYCKIYVD